MTTKQFSPGDPAPWFDAQALAGTSHNLGVMAGRWIALFFVHQLDDAVVTRTLADIVSSIGRFFNDDHVIFYGVLKASPADTAPFVQASHRGLGFMMDYSGEITRLYGAANRPQVILLDPMLRVAKIFWVGGESGASSQEIISYLGTLPLVDGWAGAPLTAPALIIPQVFEPEFCDYLVGLYEKNGGKDSGFMVDQDGKTKTIIDHNLKQRHDFVVEDTAVREMIRDRVVRRVVPTMERFLQYKPTRMDRYLVSCYGADGGGHFSRHRDNVNAGARHRKFAASFNLNSDYDGCDLFFPEFGRRLYRAPAGGVVVFSTGALHQVTPITRGKRYAFVPFFYGEEESCLRLANNAQLHEGEGVYTGEKDKLLA